MWNSPLCACHGHPYDTPRFACQYVRTIILDVSHCFCLPFACGVRVRMPLSCSVYQKTASGREGQSLNSARPVLKMENDENFEARESRIQRIPRGGPKFGPGQISYTFFNVHYFGPVQTEIFLMNTISPRSKHVRPNFGLARAKLVFFQLKPWRSSTAKSSTRTFLNRVKLRVWLVVRQWQVVCHFHAPGNCYSGS